MSSNTENTPSIEDKDQIQTSRENPSTKVSPRDDGYQSKAGESIAEDLSFRSDARSVDGDSIMQVTPRLTKIDENQREEKKAQNSIPAIVYPENEGKDKYTSKHDVSSDVSFCVNSEEWDEIHRVVERFSQNTITLLSWIDELEDIWHDEITATYFYNSQFERKAAAKRHVEALYEDVKEDAAILLRNLAGERSTILAVLEKVELQCLRFGISVGDDMSDLCNIVPLKKALRSSLAPPKLQIDLAAPLASYEEFKPLLTSTPRMSPASKQPMRRSNRIQSRRKDVVACWKKPCSEEDYPSIRSLQLSEEIMSEREPLVRSSSITLRRNWMEFESEVNSVLEWLKTMEMKIRQAEIGDLCTSEIEVLFEKYWHQFVTNGERRECLNIKANYIRTMFPEMEYDVQTKLFEVDHLWQELVKKLCGYVAPLSPIYPRIDQYPPPPYQPRDRELFLASDWLYARPLTMEEWRQHRPFLGTDVQLSDFSFRQIRDRVDLDWRVQPCLSLDQTRQRRLAIHSANERERNTRKALTHLDYSDACDDIGTHDRLNCVEFEEKILPCHRQMERCSGPWMVPKGSSSMIHSVEDHFTARKDRKLLRNVNKWRNDRDLDDRDEEHESNLLSGNPYLLSSRIKEFHHWLKEIEDEAYKTGRNTTGWDPHHLCDMLALNRHRLLSLQCRKVSLSRILSSSEDVMENHNRDISEFFVLWSSWMLKQRYWNLVLYSIDMECILERRLEILEKGTVVLNRSRSNEGVWNDRPADMIPSVNTTDEDYLIFFEV